LLPTAAKLVFDHAHRAVSGFWQRAGAGLGSGDDAGVGEHLLDDLQISVRSQGERGGG
jgi:hypothetical protein